MEYVILRSICSDKHVNTSKCPKKLCRYPVIMRGWKRIIPIIAYPNEVSANQLYPAERNKYKGKAGAYTPPVK